VKKCVAARENLNTKQKIKHFPFLFYLHTQEAVQKQKEKRLTGWLSLELGIQDRKKISLNKKDNLI